MQSGQQDQPAIGIGGLKCSGCILPALSRQMDIQQHQPGRRSLQQGHRCSNGCADTQEPQTALLGEQTANGLTDETRVVDDKKRHRCDSDLELEANAALNYSDCRRRQGRWPIPKWGLRSSNSPRNRDLQNVGLPKPGLVKPLNLKRF